MTKIQNNNLEQIVNEHYDALKNKLKDFPTSCKYSLKEVLTAKPKKLEEIAIWAKDKKDEYQFMIQKYKNFTTKKKEYNAYDLADKLQINVCPYCNLNYTYTIITKNNKQIIRPEFDHFYDKDTYPILALSFYNLIPSCHICNSTLKGTKEFSINDFLHPYLDSFDKVAKFELKIEDSSFYHNIKGFKIKLNTQNERAKNIIDIFKLQKRYNLHKDIILELIQKEVIYNDSYLDELFKNYEGTLFKNREDLQRLISSGFIDESEINKRPLSKLIKDISSELELW